MTVSSNNNPDGADDCNDMNDVTPQKKRGTSGTIEPLFGYISDDDILASEGKDIARKLADLEARDHIKKIGRKKSSDPDWSLLGPINDFISSIESLSIKEKKALLERGIGVISEYNNNIFPGRSSHIIDSEVDVDKSTVSRSKVMYEKCAEFINFPDSKAEIGAKNAWDVIRLSCEKYGWPLPYTEDLACHHKLYAAYQNFCSYHQQSPLKNRSDRVNDQLTEVGVENYHTIAEEQDMMLRALSALSKRTKRRQ